MESGVLKQKLDRLRTAALLLVGAASSRVGVAEAGVEPDSGVKPYYHDPLPSWNERDAKKAIFEFVARATTSGSPDFVPIDDRIAVFDNDGTLWSEQPIPVQLEFALDRVEELAPQHPEWKNEEPFKSVLEGNAKGLLNAGERGLMKLLTATHTGNTTDEFSAIVEKWITTARHPKLGRLYTDLVYQPMLELLAYLRENGFRTFIVSGGGVEFMRTWAERVYGIPPEQVIGSRAKTKYEVREGVSMLVRLPEADLVDDRAGKPVGINQAIGRRPIAAFGNSDGDYEMLDWVTSQPRLGFGMIIHHTDGEREWAYDRASHVGRLSRGLEDAASKGWIVVDMARDWRLIYPFEK